jgi:hypothetical protein
MIPDGVEFTDSNDYNPEVETECGCCGGTGQELLDPGHVSLAFVPSAPSELPEPNRSAE